LKEKSKRKKHRVETTPLSICEALSYQGRKIVCSGGKRRSGRKKDEPRPGEEEKGKILTVESLLQMHRQFNGLENAVNVAL